MQTDGCRFRQNYGTKQVELSSKSAESKTWKKQKGRKPEKLPVMLHITHSKDGKASWVYLSNLNSQRDWEKTGSSCDRSQVNVSVWILDVVV